MLRYREFEPPTHTSGVYFEFNLFLVVNNRSQVQNRGIIKVPLVVGVVLEHFKTLGDTLMYPP